MIEKNDLGQIKQYIESSVGKKVRLSSSGGKKKALVREGVIENSYPSIFTVKFENDFENTRRLSFSYTDILTKVVDLVVFSKDGSGAQQAV
jgi:uncharacterized protein Veg